MYKHKRAILYVLMILFGVVSGMSDSLLLQNMGALVSDIFIRIFKCISLPIIALSLIVTLSCYSAEQGTQKIWQRTIVFTLATTAIAAAISCLLYLLIAPENVGATTVIATPENNSLTYWQHLAGLIPENIFSPFLEHQVMGVLLVGIILGIAIRYIPDQEARKTITQFFKGAHGVFLVITKWVVAVIPIGLYGFITTTVIQFRNGMDVKGIGAYLAVIVLANLVQGFVVLPLWLKSNGIRPFVNMKKMLPALSLAFFSKSSAGTLPVTIATAEKNLNMDSRVSRLVLPLCTSLNMNGCAAFIFVTVIFLMQNHGIAITPATLVLWIGVATITAIGNAGVPMGCFFLSASLLASMNVPITLLGIILPFYSVIDMVETALNVWSDACVASVVDEKIKQNELEADGLVSAP
ncbi:MAG TPA: dicarboxylate/amino acid:cation symporter [Gammaproteobacteria bacterium]|nr:dicarboxylate/amino acid:cation symporter [Gammaproteobacteria bacterium]